MWLEKDIVSIASIIFNIETAIKMGYNLSEVKIEVSRETDTGRDLAKIEDLLNNLLKYVLFRDVKIKFHIKNMKPNRRGLFGQSKQCDNICLFSGGVDSLSGILYCRKELGDVHGVFSAHGDLSRSINIVNNLSEKISKKENIPIHTLYAPKMYALGYSQLRGFLYTLFGSVYVSMLNSKNLIISECGPTMYQPQFSPYDTVTMTTHPFILQTANEIINILLKRKIKIIIPYENMTKSEVIAASPYYDFFKYSHSCISTRMGINEGTCYGCITRRLGFLVADVEDSFYDKNPIKNYNQNADHLLSLLRFSYDILFDYADIPDFSKDIISIYNKKDLFKRFALDNFSALYEYANKYSKLNPRLKELFIPTMKKLDKQKIEKRIEKVRRKTIKPNFNKFVLT
jgi:7-cyano-7-deazaguanine synthase in queuosine biosynthesis